MALSSVVLFLAYRLKYGWIRGMYTVMLLFTTTFWLQWNYNEWPVVLFTICTLVYLFVRWYEHDDRIALYAITAVSGIFFYIKWSYGQVVFALAMSTLIVDRKRVRDTIDVRTVAICGLLFLLSLTPVFLSLVTNDFGSGASISSANPVVRTGVLSVIAQRTSVRYHQLSTGILQPVLSPLTAIPIYPVLLIAGVLIALTGNERIYAVTFILLFSLLYYAPFEFYATQLVILIPFIPMLLGLALRRVTSSILSNTPGIDGIDVDADTVLLVGIGVLVLMSAISVPPRKGPSGPHSVTASAYSEFRQLNVSPVVMTNIVHAYLLADLDPRVSQQYIIGKSWKGIGFDSFRMMAGGSEDNITVLLANQSSCPRIEKGAETCGLSTQQVWTRSDYRYVERAGSPAVILSSGFAVGNGSFQNNRFSIRFWFRPTMSGGERAKEIVSFSGEAGFSVAGGFRGRPLVVKNVDGGKVLVSERRQWTSHTWYEVVIRRHANGTATMSINGAIEDRGRWDQSGTMHGPVVGSAFSGGVDDIVVRTAGASTGPMQVVANWTFDRERERVPNEAANDGQPALKLVGDLDRREAWKKKIGAYMYYIHD